MIRSKACAKPANHQVLNGIYLIYITFISLTRLPVEFPFRFVAGCFRIMRNEANSAVQIYSQIANPAVSEAVSMAIFAGQILFNFPR